MTVEQCFLSIARFIQSDFAFQVPDLNPVYARIAMYIYCIEIDQLGRFRLQQRLLPHPQTYATRVLDLQAVAMQNSGFDNHFTDWVSRQTDVLDAVNNLGNLYSDQDKLEEAERCYCEH